MNEDRPSRPSNAVQDGRPRNWLERLGQIIKSEPKDKQDLLNLLNDAQQRALLDHDAVTMIEGVMEVSEMQVRDIMVPRAQMEVVERDAKLKDFLPVIVESAHSRFPVIGENRDEIVGIVLAKDLLPYAAGNADESFNIREVLRSAMIVPESKRLNVLLREFQTSRNHMAIVVDEYGGVSGLVTIEDVLEQIVGEIEDEHDVDDEESFILPAGKGRFSVRGLTQIEDFNTYFGCNFSDGEFDTVAGMVMGAFGHMPKRGEYIDLSGYRFTVLRADNRRLYLLEVTAVKEEEIAAEENPGDETPV